MPTVTVPRSLSPQELMIGLQNKLGSQYEVAVHGNGLKVKQSLAATATVNLVNSGDATVVRVHGGGLLTSRLIDEFGIAKKVASAIQQV